MAHDEQPREDLLAEARALVERVSLRIMGGADQDDVQVVIGFRRDQSTSFYFGADRVYQFTSTGQLRRAFVDGLMYKADHAQLIALTRERTADEIRLVSRTLNEMELATFVHVMKSHLDRLRRALAKQEFEIIGQVSENNDLIVRIGRWLERFADGVAIAATPRTR